MRRPKSDIPLEAKERIAKKAKSHSQGYRAMECVLRNQIVGQRVYAPNGQLVVETPIQAGKRNGCEYIWDEDGLLLSVEPYVSGKIHGLAKQYGRSGKVIGMYRMKHGTGLDVWRYESENGSVAIAEIHAMKDGSPHGIEWWFRTGLPVVSLWHERHWYQGVYHGVERQWNIRDKLKQGYPKYWIRGQQVSKAKYLKASLVDKTLPRYQERDNKPKRRIPLEVK